MTMKRNRLAILALGASAIFGGIAAPASAESDVYWSVRSSSHAPGYSSTAGILTIDGRRFTIRSTRNIGRDIVNAFRRQGYEASCVNGRVVVCYDPYCPPKVHWYQRGYSASFERWSDRLEICWSEIRQSGYSVYYGKDHSRGHWNHDRRPQRWYPRRRGCN
jgi:hypothetical protein